MRHVMLDLSHRQSGVAREGGRGILRVTVGHHHLGVDLQQPLQADDRVLKGFPRPLVIEITDVLTDEHLRT